MQQSRLPVMAPLVALLLLLVTAGRVVAAAPWILLVSGPSLAHPVVIADWNANLALLLGDEVTVEPADVRGRPSYDLSLFWGSEWERYVADGRPLDTLRPEQASQHGRLFPPTGNQPALLLLDPPGFPRSVTPAGLAVLARAGVLIDAAPAALPRSGDITLSVSWLVTAGSILLLGGWATHHLAGRRPQAALSAGVRSRMLPVIDSRITAGPPRGPLVRFERFDGERPVVAQRDRMRGHVGKRAEPRIDSCPRPCFVATVWAPEPVATEAVELDRPAPDQHGTASADVPRMGAVHVQRQQSARLTGRYGRQRVSAVHGVQTAIAGSKVHEEEALSEITTRIVA